MNDLVPAAWILAGYLLGSVSFAYLVVRARAGVDLRTIGSGNLGATNVGRALGRKWALIVYALDFLKGFALPAALRACEDRATWDGGPPLAASVGLAAFLGHCYPLWHGFRGGKGVATASGLIVALAPWAGLATLGLFGATLAAFRMISLGSVVAAVALPFLYVAVVGRAEALGAGGRWILGLFALIAAWVTVRHRGNLARIAAGTEPKIGTRRSAGPRDGVSQG
ncbi:MAG TPA: glycerol-3-phosphate 1-O-acyltransferase PlsY [Planctomycetota bacterium]|nr:glycerol-3-phosphate 1-O-acyltransferase PlsY [Planctomycetota bacterium]